jgi:hypothetical protein
MDFIYLTNNKDIEMTTYDYTAYAMDGIHKAQYGEIEANTLEEAERKVQALYTYPVLVKLPKFASDHESQTPLDKQQKQ